MAALLTDVGPGDEVIMPSFTFVSTANAFALRGATPVFVDIRAGHAQPRRVANRGGDHAAHPRDRAGPLRRRRLRDGRRSARSRREHGLFVIEDAAQGVMAAYKGRPLGSIGDASARQLSRDQERDRRRGRRADRQPRRVGRSCRDPVGEGDQPRRSFRAARSTSTRGSISARRSCPARSTPRFSGRSSSTPKRLPRRRLAIWHAITSSSRRSNRRPACSGVRSFPTRARANAHMYYVLVARPDLRAGLMASAQRSRDQCRHPLCAAASRAGRPAFRPRCRCTRRDRKRWRPAREAAALPGDDRR